MSSPIKKSSDVHPSVPAHHDHHRQLGLILPAAILSLTAALSPEDTEVLAYLISCHSNPSSTHRRSGASAERDTDGRRVHTPLFGCNCFWCYTSFWTRWDASANRDLINEVIEAYEEALSRKKPTNSKRRRKSNIKLCDDHSSTKPVDTGGNGGCPPAKCGGDGEVGSPEKGSSVRKVMGSIGEQIWAAWAMV